MQLVTFQTLGGHGETLQGEPWSPGPVPSSWWVRDTKGAWHVVKMRGAQAVAAPQDPRMQPCTKDRESWHRHTGNPMRDRQVDCPLCSDGARNEYIRRFRWSGRPFTQAETARWVALFEVETQA